ncbi:hypothetical protein [Rhodopseudomonas sp. RCAM05734]|uniref:hypothetical protein n=1 Tax=Rhodopseudomonas sp. RCAM05734 TaxID=3457549 RepID=UPI004043C0CB
MPDYSASNELGGTKQAIASTYKTLLGLSVSSAVALRRPRIFDVIFGVEGTPSDQAIVWDASRTTTVGTGTSATPNPIDTADPAALTVATANLTVEPTVTASSNLLPAAVNQRATIRWVPTPGKELVIPATNLAGIAFRAKSSGYVGFANVTAMFNE